MISPPEIIRERARAVVRGVLNDEVGSWRWLKKLIATTTKEYRGRFLYELIQNGFDAHPADAHDGQLAIHFHEDEGEHGVLYVANGGNPLSRSNFEKMASLGDSDKEIGVGIGNKGVGFKSVFQISSVPEVFSARDTNDPGFSGFTFRFGTDADLVSFDLNETEEQKVKAELAFSLLTVPLETIPPRALELRAAGYVTVIRLPASSARAAKEIIRRIETLTESRAPIMLFLDRIADLSVKSSTDSDPVVLTRRELKGKLLTRVVLDDQYGYIVFKSAVPNTELRAALEESVEEGVLDPAWLEWKEDASVSVAVGDDWLIEDPAPFTFLPMSDQASSPFSGHINAPFVTDFARLGVDGEQPVNRLMMRKIAELCASAAETLIARRRKPNAIVDLLAWRAPDAALLDDAVGRLYGRSLGEHIRLPAVGRTAWATLDDLCSWPDSETAVLTPDRVVTLAGALLIDIKKVDEQRIEHLAYCDLELDPAPEVIGGWVERVARGLLDIGRDLSIWRDFYNDLAELFDDGDSLSGRLIILTQGWDLAAAEEILDEQGESKARKRSKRAVFFSPRTASSDDDDSLDSEVALSPPRTLANRLTFVNRDLEWYEGGEQTPGRRFLQREGLVRQFRVSALLSFLGRLLGAKPNDAVKRDALQFAFALFLNDSAKHAKELGTVGLSVISSEGGWIPASEALFTKDWPVDGGKEISRLAAISDDANSEFAQLPALLVARPADFGIGEDNNITQWCEFLKILGVSAKLPILNARDSRRIRGVALTKAIVAGVGAPSSVPRAVLDQWQRGMTGDPNYHHPDTDFSTQQPICWLLGQGEVAELSQQLRVDYSRLVMLTLPMLSDTDLRSTWRRERPGGFTTILGSPLLAFLQTAEWVAVTEPAGTETVFRRPDASWYAGVEDQMAASYSPLISSRLRRVMESFDRDGWIWNEVGFRNWDDRHSAELIDHLTELFENNEIPDMARGHFRSTLAACWAAVGDPSCRDRPHMEQVLLIERGGQFELQTRDDLAGETIYVSAKGDQTAGARLVRELGWPTVLVDSTDPIRIREVADVLIGAWQEDVQVTSDWELDVLVDGTLWQPSGSEILLVNEIPWLPVFIGSVMRYPQVSTIRIGRQLQRVLDELGTIRLVHAKKLFVVSGAGHQPLPARLHGVLPMYGEIPALLTEGLASPPTWSQFEYLLRGVLEILDQERFSTEISLASRKLADAADSPVTCPSTAELADALQVTKGEIDDVAHALAADVSLILSRLSVVGPCLWGDTSIEVLASIGLSGSSRDDLLEALTKLCADGQRAREILDAAAAASSADALRRALNVSIEDFNVSLSNNFPSMALINNELEQNEEFALRVGSRRSELRDRARRARIGRFRAGQTQTDWPQIRDLSFLNPNLAWATTRDELGDELIDAVIEQQMQRALGVEGGSDDSLSEWVQVQSSNGKPLTELIMSSRRIIRAWCDRAKVAAPAMWESDDAAESVRLALNNVGALDFDALADRDLPRWLDRIGGWPSGMELTLELSRLGLSPEELDRQESAAAAARAEKARAARRIEFQGREIDVDETMNSLVQSVSEFLSADPPSLQSAYRSARMYEIAKGFGGAGSALDKSVKGTARAYVPRLSQAQAAGVGLVGEMIAYHWLQYRDPGIVDETCWKSGNVRFKFDGLTGDDGLGFDFEVPRRGGSVMYEVKASTGDAGTIELGETEVRCAQENSRNDRWRLLIVENALSTDPRVHMLPNPFHHDSRSLFEFVGNRVRMQFRLDG
jgi:hypothetical protein